MKKQVFFTGMTVMSLINIGFLENSNNVGASMFPFDSRNQVEMSQKEKSTHGAYSLSANDIVIERGNISKQQIIIAANAYATNVLSQEGHYPKINVIIKSSNVQNKVGEYQVTFGIKEDAFLEKTINVSVVDQKESGPENSIYVLSAQDGVVLEDQMDDQSLIQATAAEAKDLMGRSTDVIVKHSTVKGVPGEYQVTFGIKEDSTVEKTVGITVKENMNVPNLPEQPESPNALYFITAYNGVVLEDQTDDQSLIQAAAAEAKDLMGRSTDVIVKHSTVKGVPGEYQVTFGIKEDSTVEKTVGITVKENMNVPNLPEQPESPNALYFITAYNGVVLEDQTDDQSLIQAAAAEAKDLMGRSTDVIVKHSTVKGVPGEYQVTFGIKEDSTVEKTVGITVKENTNVPNLPEQPESPNALYFITAYNGVVLEDQTDDQSLIQAAAAEAKDLMGRSTDVIVKHSTVKGVPGEYQVTFGIKEDPTVEKTVGITVGNSLPSDDVGGAHDLPGNIGEITKSKGALHWSKL